LLCCLIAVKTSAQQPQIVASINLKKLGIHYSEYDREQLYSMLDSDKIILAVDKSLLFIKNNGITKKLMSPVHIFAFDITSNGNGIIVDLNDHLYRVKNFHISTTPINCKFTNRKEGNAIEKVDMINDSIARFALNITEGLIYANINNLANGKYKVVNDIVSKFISHSISTYVGNYNVHYYFLEWDFETKSECLVARTLEAGNLIVDKKYKFGDLGRVAEESVPIRYNERSHYFYEMLYKKDLLVLYKFDIRDY